MAFYVILDNTIHDSEKYDEYKKAVPPIVERYGGEYLVRDGDIHVLVGDWKPERIVMFRWPSMEALTSFMEAPEYQPWKELRESCTTTNQAMVVEGI